MLSFAVPNLYDPTPTVLVTAHLPTAASLFSGCVPTMNPSFAQASLRAAHLHPAPTLADIAVVSMLIIASIFETSTIKSGSPPSIATLL